MNFEKIMNFVKLWELPQVKRLGNTSEGLVIN